MNPKEWAELLRYSSPFSILVIKDRNEIVEIICPFEVELKHNVGVLIKGTRHSVDMVKLSIKLITVFVINDDAYYFYHFNILIK